MKKIIVLTLIACVLMFANTSCHKDADYVLHKGESFCLGLAENPSSNMIWEWENSDKTDVVSMIRLSNPEAEVITDSATIASDTTCIEGYGPVIQFYCFRAEKKGYTVVKMVYAKDNPDYQKRINFSICVID